MSPSGVVVLTDRRLAARPLPEVVRAAVDGGARWVVLRERDLAYAERRALADSLRRLLPPGQLIVAGPDPLGGDAVHLSTSDVLTSSVEHQRRPEARYTSLAFHWSAPVAQQRPVGGGEVTGVFQWSAPVAPRGGLRVVGRSCHGAGELSGLSGEDYVMLSPVYATETKPGYGPPLTPEGAAGLLPPVPWLALGGVTSADRARRCADAGAAGVAVLGAVMRAADPARVVRELATAFDRAGVP